MKKKCNCNKYLFDLPMNEKKTAPSTSVVKKSIMSKYGNYDSKYPLLNKRPSEHEIIKLLTVQQAQQQNIIIDKNTIESEQQTKKAAEARANNNYMLYGGIAASILLVIILTN